MVYCCAYGCNTSSKVGGNGFFHFPLRNKDVLKQWLVNIKRKNFTPTNSSRICHLHFESQCFELSGNPEFLNSIGYECNSKRKLKVGAVPTIFSNPELKDCFKKSCTADDLDVKCKRIKVGHSGSDFLPNESIVKKVSTNEDSENVVYEIKDSNEGTLSSDGSFAQQTTGKDIFFKGIQVWLQGFTIVRPSHRSL